MKRILLIALVLIAFVTLSFRMIGNKKGSVATEVSNTEASDSKGGFTSSDPIN